jgi:hypothetical protein
LAIEPLEKRSLLTVSLTFNVNVAHLPGTTGVVPIVNADVAFLYIASSGPYKGIFEISSNFKTSSSGKCVATLNDVSVGQSIAVYVYTKGVFTGDLAMGTYNVAYAVDMFGSKNPLLAYDYDEVEDVSQVLRPGFFEAQKLSQSLNL